MSEPPVLIQVASNGRMSIPAKHRKALGLEKGGVVTASVENGVLRLQTAQSILDRLRAKAAPYARRADDSVERFVADRRADAEHDEVAQGVAEPPSKL